jgi:hypothetical protein
MEPKIYQYRLRTTNGRWAADVILRSDGYFSTVSDRGGYAYWWGSPGMEFRAFVAQLERQSDYVCSKLGRHDWYDAERTLRAIKQHILTYRREGSMTKQAARKEWEVLAEACGCYSTKELRDITEMDLLQFHRWYESTSIGDASEFARHDYKPDVRGFCEHVMPLLAEAIRAELAQETRTPAESSSS